MTFDEVEFDKETALIVDQLSEGMVGNVKDAFIQHMKMLYQHKQEFDDIVNQRLVAKYDVCRVYLSPETNSNTLH